ncbi:MULTISPECIES: hypothetical protein [unclassified Streptomyces]|uniref:hypothetical protein n=1 Tax=unclassified Streptomyces TaxID=2593676 RepID=UPI002E2E6BE3|nr:hypothetical protein [Streptomyces sp. NBC_00273]
MFWPSGSKVSILFQRIGRDERTVMHETLSRDETGHFVRWSVHHRHAHGGERRRSDIRRLRVENQ